MCRIGILTAYRIDGEARCFFATAVAAHPSRFLPYDLALLGNTQHQFVTEAYVHLNSESGELRYSAAAIPLSFPNEGPRDSNEENGLMLALPSLLPPTPRLSTSSKAGRMAMYTGILEASNARGFLRAPRPV